MNNPTNTICPWIDSNAKQLLKNDILSGKVHPLMMPRDVYKMRPEYLDYVYKNFRSNFRSLQRALKKLQDRAVSDNADLEVDLYRQRQLAAGRTVQPPLMWVDSEARNLLKQDVTDGLHSRMKPIDLWQSKAEYRMFPLSTFRKHIYQECRSRKTNAYWSVIKERKLMNK